MIGQILCVIIASLNLDEKYIELTTPKESYTLSSRSKKLTLNPKLAKEYACPTELTKAKRTKT
ncbi:MAG: hypothetical protein HOA61_14435 [Bacteroidetes bacterium]|jgi:hypothetical protein|nr:hypothetical protein [Bacteroidota bacterium]